MIVACSQCDKRFDKPPCHVARVKAVFCSKSCYDRAQKRRIRLVCPVCDGEFGVRPSEVKKYKCCSLICTQQNRKGANNANWQGGIAKSRRPEMSTAQYKNWRKAVFERDDYTCIDCGKRGGTIEADHSKRWVDSPELRYDVSNGVTRCRLCHVARHTKHEGQWVGTDFDGTLANFDCDWASDYRAVGAPIPAMVTRVKRWLLEGEDVRIFTARLDCYHPKYFNLMEWEVKKPIEKWCKEHLGVVLPITNRKDHHMRRLYDDRAHRVELNTGRITEETKDNG